MCTDVGQWLWASLTKIDWFQWLLIWYEIEVAKEVGKEVKKKNIEPYYIIFRPKMLTFLYSMEVLVDINGKHTPSIPQQSALSAFSFPSYFSINSYQVSMPLNSSIWRHYPS